MALGVLNGLVTVGFAGVLAVGFVVWLWRQWG
jgi:hypothetical protein